MVKTETDDLSGYSSGWLSRSPAYRSTASSTPSYIGTPSSITCSNMDSLISPCRAMSSSASQFTQTYFPARKAASGDVNQTVKFAGSAAGNMSVYDP